MANKQTLPGITDTSKGLVNGAQSPTLPQIRWESPLRNMGNVMTQTAYFGADYTGLRYEEYEAKYNNMAAQMFHEMDDATDPCQLQDIKNKYDQSFKQPLDDTVWAKSYLSSRQKKRWTDDLNTNYEKKYVQKMHDFTLIQTERTLNEMSSAAAETGDIYAAASYFDSGMNQTGSAQHLTVDEKNRLQMNYAKDFIGKLYTKDPNFALSFVNQAEKGLAKYGIDFNEVRRRATDYNNERANDEWRAYTRAKTLKEDEDTAAARFYATKVLTGNMSSADAEREVQLVSDNAFLKYRRLTKETGAPSANPNVAEFSRVYNEEGAEKALDRFKTDANWQDDSEIRTLINNSVLFPSEAENYDRDIVSAVTADLENAQSEDEVSRIAWNYEKKGLDTATQSEIDRLNLDSLNLYRMNNLAELAGQSSETRTLINQAYAAQENLIKSANSQKLSGYENNAVLAPGDMNTQINSALGIVSLDVPEENKTQALKTISGNIKGIEKDKFSVIQAETFNTMISDLDRGIYYTEKNVADLARNKFLTAEQTSDYLKAARARRKIDAEYFFRGTISDNQPITYELLSRHGIDKGQQLEMMDSQATKDHNKNYYENKFLTARENTLNNLNDGKISFATALEEVRFASRSNGRDPETDVANFSTYYEKTNNRTLISQNLSLFDDFYGFYDDKNLIEVNRRNQARRALESAMAARLAEGKDLSAYTEEYIRSYALSSKPTAFSVNRTNQNSRYNYDRAMGLKNVYFEGEDDVESGKYLAYKEEGFWENAKEYGNSLLKNRALLRNVLDDKNISDNKNVLREMYAATEKPFTELTEEYAKDKTTYLGAALNLYNSVFPFGEEEGRYNEIADILYENFIRYGKDPLGKIIAGGDRAVNVAVNKAILSQIDPTVDNAVIGNSVIPQDTIKKMILDIEEYERGRN